ncbi:MAG: metal ABC transporter ATP-binding protein, partial [Muribaculaceae bacterium]|nr:metal ABC transporter ATP-binding protein [Muribaculaceae bacterium]
GDFMAITGPNGGGKTTLLRVMLRLLKPSEGRVVYYHDGEETKRLKIGYLPQKSNIDTRFPITVGETIKSGQIKSIFARRNSRDEEDFERVVELCGVRDYLDRTVGVLSGGQLQRTLLARALVSNPEVIVLDEPLSYVDKTFERQIYSMMEDLAKEHTIVLVSHEMSVISGMANRHIIVDRGIHECTSHHHSFTECDD